jgi:hypothetical protein
MLSNAIFVRDLTRNFIFFTNTLPATKPYHGAVLLFVAS